MMGLVIKKISKQEYIMSTWSGGNTTQIGINPELAEYKDRDFLWRISSATVDLEESTFTALPDYNRVIMTLKGDMELIHNGGEVIALEPFEPHEFDGADHTLSRGRVVDFNLMMRKNHCRGFVHAFRLHNGQRKAIFWENAESKNTALFYAFGTEAAMLIDGEEYKLDEGDSLVLEGGEGSSPDISLVSGGEGAIIMANVEVI
jgi:environmental stress-induced protein Ves